MYLDDIRTANKVHVYSKSKKEGERSSLSNIFTQEKSCREAAVKEGESLGPVSWGGDVGDVGVAAQEEDSITPSTILPTQTLETVEYISLIYTWRHSNIKYSAFSS